MAHFPFIKSKSGQSQLAAISIELNRFLLSNFNYA